MPCSYAQWRSFIGVKGALANENSHYMNSKMAIVHYCSKRVAPPHLSKIQGQAPPLTKAEVEGSGWRGEGGQGCGGGGQARELGREGQQRCIRRAT